ncbi:DUF4097 family beta strand repeat-containing protein [Streptomyces rubellomurinus]|uniref:DUF4097 domain-containing protein n=2 Tax=Streptomyces TaxID=1883 RepID=A0A0F2TCH4_STRR3|nr:DUF4097 family beta strand repeat-containing protein [Streptomyces rubellomurinus]KJS54552.1 hypothetical protein VM98_18540 [Streptomyces rubellomurinus subsp. indigoferus]KJS60191.1 hypothetical protein VM95_22875 [Streptomyces rubellomurinus]
MSQWTIEGPGRTTFEDAVRELHVRVIDGTVNVVAAEGPARMEVTELRGEPLHVTLVDGVLTVTYKDINSWGEFGEQLRSVASVKSFLGSFKRKRTVGVTLTVPVDAAVKVGTVSAGATVTGIDGHVSVQSASGDATLAKVTGRIDAATVTGDVDAQAVGGELKVNTVSGQLTVIAGTADRVQANSVTGAVTLDLDVAGETDVKVNTVSGPVVVRIPSLADATVEAGSTTGDVSSTFEQLKMSSTWGAKKISGQLGEGRGSLNVTTVSGAVTVLRRPDAEDDAPARELPAGPDLTKPAGPDLTKEA